METFGVVAGRHDQCCRRVGTDAEELEQVGNGGDEEGFDPLVEFGELVVEEADPVRQRRQRCLGGRRHRIGRSTGTKPLSFGDEGGDREPFHAATELFRSAVAEVAHLNQSLAPGLAGRTLGDDKDSDGFDGTVARLGLALRPTTQGGPGRFDGIEGIGLAAPAAFLAIWSVHLEDLHTHPA